MKEGPLSWLIFCCLVLVVCVLWVFIFFFETNFGGVIMDVHHPNIFPETQDEMVLERESGAGKYLTCPEKKRAEFSYLH